MPAFLVVVAVLALSVSPAACWTPPDLPGGVADAPSRVIGDSIYIFPGPSCADAHGADVGRCRYEIKEGAASWTTVLDKTKVSTKDSGPACMGTTASPCPSTLDYIGTASVTVAYGRADGQTHL